VPETNAATCAITPLTAGHGYWDYTDADTELTGQDLGDGVVAVTCNRDQAHAAARVEGWVWFATGPLGDGRLRDFFHQTSQKKEKQDASN
jgi:hypothetical protein